MSSSWRGPTRPSAKPAVPAAGAAAEAEAAEAVAVEASAIQMPAGPLKVKEVERKPIERKPAEKPQAQATIEVRRHTDPPVVKRESKVREIGSRIATGITQGATALGGVTIGLCAVIKDRSIQVGKRMGIVKEGGRSCSRTGSLPRKTVVLGFGALAVVIVLVAWIVRDQGAEVPPPLSQQGGTHVRDANLSSLLPLPPAGGTSRAADQGQAAVPPGRTSPALTAPGTEPKAENIEAQPKPKLSRTSVDPREKGQRYYILATYSVNKEEYLMPLLEYLWSQGVEAGAINGHNSGFFQVIALQGFTRDEINSKSHKQYEDTLRRLGRKWKAQGGGDDLQGLYLQEYSGTQAKLSIMKAN